MGTVSLNTNIRDLRLDPDEILKFHEGRQDRATDFQSLIDSLITEITIFDDSDKNIAVISKTSPQSNCALAQEK
jgi:hypothetical protein